MHADMQVSSHMQHELRHLWILVRPLVLSRMGVLALATYVTGMFALFIPGVSIAFALLPLAATVVFAGAIFIYFSLLDMQPLDAKGISATAPPLSAFTRLIGMNDAMHWAAASLSLRLRASSHARPTASRQFHHRVAVSAGLMWLAQVSLGLCLIGSVFGLVTALQAKDAANFINHGGLTVLVLGGLLVSFRHLRTLSRLSSRPVPEPDCDREQPGLPSTISTWLGSGISWVWNKARAAPWAHLAAIAIITPLEPMMRLALAALAVFHLHALRKADLDMMRRERDEAKEAHYTSAVRLLQRGLRQSREPTDPQDSEDGRSPDQ
jgi:hypothetical protein